MTLELLNRNRVKAGPSTSTVSPPGCLRSMNRRTSRTMNEIQNP